MENPYRSLPSVDRVLSEPALAALEGVPRELLAEFVREAIARARQLAGEGRPPPDAAALAAAVARTAAALQQGTLTPAINATGVIIHTNLGRAPLSRATRAAMEAVSRGYSNLEFDLDSGERGSRFSHLDGLLQRVTGAQAGIAVNNNASAALLALTALAAGREVIISRSQAVEIGGGFRIPDVMRQSGARLVEVGTTNRTYLRDFAEAIGPDTAAILRVHSSNFRIIGFTAFPDLTELAALAHDRGVLLLDDVGSGCLLPVEPYGLAHEPTVQESVAGGADVTFFSGDKLLGGPQAGVVVGRRELVQRLRGHPLARAVRMDKASIAGLAATLLHYLRGEALAEIPVWRMIATPLGSLEERASAWAEALGPGATTAPGRSVVGGGSLPEETLPTVLLALRPRSPSEAAARLRRHQPPVVSRIERDRLLLDPRTVAPDEDSALVEAVRACVVPLLS
jgi:L-seryl-tRNA(Ser) seleniumtransferase